ncbi:hypothetical protein SAMN06295967_101260 [Belliella buryatensis]|uniref:Uncharacterized protein n=1 Tax=Belliella buryatensis TaxID=1500549 RepID=A0A239ALZ3_9BACT|nr:hypothetical protein [Belliella buryatensis]SNR96589.1 hypothetical protein SAMN06295967_101260 [Belliella buryatensis]
MKFTALLILTAILVLFLGPYFSYPYLMGIIVVLSYLMSSSGASSFFAAGLGMGLVWLGKAIFISIDTSSSLPDKMADLMGMEQSNLLWIATGVLGVLLGGFSGLTGALLRNLSKPKRSQGMYRY